MAGSMDGLTDGTNGPEEGSRYTQQGAKGVRTPSKSPLITTSVSTRTQEEKMSSK